MTDPPLKMKTVNSILSELCVSLCPSVFMLGWNTSFEVVGLRIRVLGAMIGLYTLGEPRWKRRIKEVRFHRLSIQVIGCMIGSFCLLGPAFEIEAEA